MFHPLEFPQFHGYQLPGTTHHAADTILLPGTRYHRYHTPWSWHHTGTRYQVSCTSLCCAVLLRLLRSDISDKVSRARFRGEIG
ncbi:Os10g0184366 [Oryza sativa Japonica Group]|uniref:Os10g0184366 protein n=1 Tax=Oryza sativa subsp. japonica TaxID=39947 RepID=A0A0P0XSA1_ORYSJ|nr:Os10g0184366 [Oryza sativa Japonica Group]